MKNKIIKSKNKILYLLAILLMCVSFPLVATEYYVDSQNGSDQASGTSQAQAWRSLEKVNAANFRPGDVVRFARGGLWRGALLPKSGAAGAPITYTCYGSDNLPKPRFYGSAPLNRSADWVKVETKLWRTSSPVNEAPASMPLGVELEVGNLIFDGVQAGFRCWSKEELKTEGNFWFDYETRYVWLVCVNNPAEIFSEIEAAVRYERIVELSDVHYAVFSDFDVRYGAASGFDGINNSNITIRNCDVSWMGGGKFDAQTRFGNGIQFWGGCHDNLVENCRLWEILDAALTNQSSGFVSQRNITWRNNLIWNCAYSYEFWFCEGSNIDNIVFTNNICLNAGEGWYRSQRPGTPSAYGLHLDMILYPCSTTSFVVTNNVFAYATEYIFFTEADNITCMKSLFMNDNVWIQPPGDGRCLVKWKNEKIYDFGVYQEKTGLDQNSTFNVWKTFDNHAPLNAVYSTTLTLADLDAQLQDGFAWLNPLTPVTGGADQQYPATYTDPSGSYEPETGYIKINVAKVDQTLTADDIFRVNLGSSGIINLSGHVTSSARLNSGGAVTYKVTDAGTTGAKIEGNIFSHSSTGTAIITATTTGNNNYNGATTTFKLTVEMQRYSVVVISDGTDATGEGDYFAGTKVNIFAGTPPEGQQFKIWTTTSQNMFFTNAKSANAMFFMPINDVTVTAVFEKIITGVETPFAQNLKVYPNPFIDQINMMGANGCTLRVVDVTGATVHFQKITKPVETVHLEQLPAGLYFFHVEKNGMTCTIKTIKNFEI